MANNFNWPVSMPYDEINIHDQSAIDISETVDITTTPKTPIAFIPFVSPKGYKDDDTLVYLNNKTISKYGDPDYDKYGLSLYLAKQFVDGGGNLLGMRVSASNSNHAHICVVAEITNTKSTDEQTKDQIITTVNFKTFSFKKDDTIRVNNKDVITSNKKDYLKSRFDSFGGENTKENDLKLIYGDSFASATDYTVIDSKTSFDASTEGKYILPLFIIYSIPYGENNYRFEIEPDRVMDTYSHTNGDSSRFYKIACYDGNDKLESVMSFTFDGYIYNNESMYVEDVFEDYSNNIGIIMYGDSSNNGCSKLIDIMKTTFDETSKDKSTDILFGSTFNGESSYTKYKIADTNIFSDIIELSGGSMGDFDSTDTKTRTVAICKSLTEAYDGTKSDLIYDEVRFPYEFLFQPIDLDPKSAEDRTDGGIDYGKKLIDAMIKLATEDRESTTIAMFTPFSTTYESAQSYMTTDIGKNSRNLYYWSEWAQIRDQYTHKRRMMPSVYFNAKAIPRTIIQYGYGTPLAGSKFYWDGFITNTVIPRTCKRDVYVANHNSRLNTMNEDGTGKAMAYEQITAQTETTQLSEINNIISLRKICSICLIVAREHRWSTIDEDTSDISSYSESVKNRIQAVMPNACKTLNITAERESINGAGSNRIHCRIDVSFKKMLKGITYDLYIL